MPALGVYFINSGKVKVVVKLPDGRETIVRILGAGDMVGVPGKGEMGIHNFSAFTLEDSALCFLGNKNLYAAWMENPVFLFNTMLYYFHEMRKVKIFANNLSCMNVREKVAHALILLNKIYGGQTINQKIHLNFPKNEIAKYCGTATEQISRTLKKMGKEKIITTGAKEIIIDDYHALEGIIANYPVAY